MARPPSPRSTPARPKPPTINELKREVLTLAGVSSTRELKRTNQDLRHLDFRRKASWRTALEVLQQAAAAYPDWEAQPPEEFRELFAAIDEASEAYGQSIEEGLRLSAQLQKAADDLESLSGELLEEADELRTVQAASRRQARQRRLN
ncbi:hypothetical protein [Aphanothece minutissima]|jgi:hypothetical protein|uniref:KfrA N-terminal DNA-binding domain-containing protein n=1 Tax=Aphanothece cf. minutissima CCALA 015 TaxID=2107695 RepID=A0ABX5F8S7_9CHRO|nr:hypothetical protein [Aphanothece minutissima]PSB37197.1 hypothetical protein C7B81_09560 [Aphanothece cf. minutissima CCALA 015]